MIFEPFDLVVVPFPFTDQAAAKRRPALVLSRSESFNLPSGHTLMAMVTSASHRRWPLDVLVAELSPAGLPSASVVRMKLFTLDNRLVLRALGHLAASDVQAVRQALGCLLPVEGFPQDLKQSPATTPRDQKRGR